jgi:hypothetical protein
MPVNVARVTTAVVGGMLTALLAAGCGAPEAGAQRAGVHQGSVPACTSYGVRAINQHLTVTREPAACRGLSQAQVNLAIGRAIYLVAGPGRHKAAWRREALRAGARLAGLISPSQATAAAPAPSYAAAGSTAPARPGRDAALDFAALGAWILAAASGSRILSAWFFRGGNRRRRTGGSGVPAVVIFGHFALAATGLLVWIIYLVTGWAAVAWTAVGLLLPVAGLGMAMVTIGLPGERAAATTAGPAAVRRPPSALVVVGHGLLAAATILLVLLAALGASGS